MQYNGIALIVSVIVFLLCPMLFAEEKPELDSSKDLGQYEDKLAEEKEATLFPIPDYPGDFFSRSALTGDWGGTRTAIAENYGIQLEVDSTGYYQGVTSGGFDNNGGWETSASADYRFKFDSGAAGLWPGGFLELHGESYGGDNINSFTGALLPANFDMAMPGVAGTGTYLTHVILTQFLSERFALTAGKIDTSLGDANAYAHGVGDQMFMNAAFNLNPVTYLTSPYSTLGGGVIYLFGPESIFSAMIYDGDGTINTAGFDTIDDGRTTIGTSLQLETDFFDKKGHQYFGFIYGFGDGEYNAQGVDPRLDLPPSVLAAQGVADEIDTEDSTWSFFYNFDQQLYSNPNNPGQDIGVFARFGIADEDTSVIRTFWSIGLGGTGLIPGRNADRFGIGYYYMDFNDERIELILPEDSEQGFEVFYNMAVTPWFKLTADLQVLDGGLAESDTAVVCALRGRIVF